VDFAVDGMVGREGPWWSISGNHYYRDVNTHATTEKRSRYLLTFALLMFESGRVVQRHCNVGSGVLDESLLGRERLLVLGRKGRAGEKNISI